MKLQGIQCSNGGREIKLATYIRPISKDGMFQCNKPFMIFFVSLTISSYVCVTLNTINGVVDWKCEILHSLWLSLYLYIYRERERKPFKNSSRIQSLKTIILWKWNWSWTLSKFKNPFATCHPKSLRWWTYFLVALDSFNLGVFESTWLTVWAPKLHIIKEDQSKRQNSISVQPSF